MRDQNPPKGEFGFGICDDCYSPYMGNNDKSDKPIKHVDGNVWACKKHWDAIRSREEDQEILNLTKWLELTSPTKENE